MKHGYNVSFLISLLMLQTTCAFLSSSSPSLKFVDSRSEQPVEEDGNSSDINEPITLVPADEADTLTQKLGKKPTLRYLSAPLSDGRTSILIPLPSDLDEKTGVVFVEDIRDGDLSQRTFRTHIFRPMKTSPISFNVKPADRNNRIRGARHSNAPNTINSIDKLLSPPVTTSTTTEPTTTFLPETTTLEPEETLTTEPTTTTTTTRATRATRPPLVRRVVNRRPISGSVRLEVRPLSKSTTTSTTTTSTESSTILDENLNENSDEEMTTIESLRWVPSLSVGTLPTTSTTSSPTPSSTSSSTALPSSTVSEALQPTVRFSSGRTRNRARTAHSSTNVVASLRVTDLVNATLTPRKNASSINLVSSSRASEEESSEESLPGTGGRDYPTFAEIPQTRFDCRNIQYPGFYADLETGCQVYHSCGSRGRRHSFLCPNGTIFSQEYLICDWWFNVACSDSPNHFLLNKEAFSAVPVKFAPLTANNPNSASPKEATDKDKVQSR